MIRKKFKTFRFKDIEFTFAIEQDTFGLGIFYWSGIFVIELCNIYFEIRRNDSKYRS